MNQEQRDTTLVASQLSCIRDDRTLFSGLSFSLKGGQALLVEGRNGSGKTSLLRILCGIRMPDEGTVSWRGEDIFRLSSGYHADTTYVGHKDGIKLDLTALENLAFAQSLGTPSGLSLQQALEKVDLAGFDDVPARNFSAGQKRRLALARLLITRSKLWILDEPFTSLDRHGITIVESLIEKHLANDGMLAVTSHHRVNLDESSIQRINLSE